ncbi:Glu/Leu/Phe/Val dehydrogenase dimerization domain-containing protein [Streptomyces griseoincarnatus]
MRTVLTYHDPVEGFPGWLVYDDDSFALAAGGCRMQSGLTRESLEALAARMTLKQRVLGTNVAGAKCGVDRDPRAPGREAALGRFVGHLRRELLTRYSMGSDMGTRFDELERLAAGHGVPSVKYAVRAAQGLTEEDFATRIGSLKAPVGPLTLGDRRAGHALAAAAVAAARIRGAGRRPRIGLQGFGTLGRSCALTLFQEGCTLVAVADEYGCVTDLSGLDVPTLIALEHGAPVRGAGGSATDDPTDLMRAGVDVLVLAAGADGVTAGQARDVDAAVVVVGANRGLGAAAEAVLEDRGVLVVPDFIGGIGGSASMEVLFGAPAALAPETVLDRVGVLMRALMDELAAAARRDRTGLRAAADRLSSARPGHPGERPYGNSPFLAAVPI